MDFDLFLPNKERLPVQNINSLVRDLNKNVFWFSNKDYCKSTQLNGVKFIWFAYMFDIPKSQLIDFWYIKIPSLLHLAAMKIHAMGQRAKWKDYVDIYFLIQKFGIDALITYAKKFFKGEVNIKLFLSQLDFFDDIDYSEKVHRMPWFERTDQEIKLFLQKTVMTACKDNLS